MGLRRSVTIWGLLLCLLLLLGNTVFSTFVIEEGFLRLEKRIVMEKLLAAYNAIDDRVNQLSLFALDWANWDDTYIYTQDRNSLFEESNLGLTTFAEQNLAGIIIRDRKGDIVFARAVNTATEDAPALLSAFMATPTIRHAIGNASGLISLGNTLYLFATHPVLTSSESGPAMGSLTMIRRLSGAVAQSIGDSLGFPIDIVPAETKMGLADQIRTAPSGEIVSNIDDKTVLGARMLPTASHPDAWILTIRTARDITRFGSTVVNYNSLVIGLSVLIFALATYLLLHIKLFKRLERVKGQISSIRKDPSLDRSINVDGHDEITDLADSLNNLMGDVRDAHREQIREAEKNADNERFLNQVLNSVSIGLLLVDPENRRIIEINDFALHLAGRTRDEVIGKTCHRLTCPSAVHNCPILDQNQPFDLSKRKLLTKDGSEIPIMKSVNFVNRGGKRFLLETIVDIREIEQSRLELERVKNGLEETVEARTKELQAANKELVALDKAKTLFLTSASHELRTPLTSILGFLSLLEKNFKKHFHHHLSVDDKLKPMADRHLQNIGIIRTEAERLGRLVNDLLDLNKIESGRMEWRDELLDVTGILDHAAEAYAGLPAINDQVKLVVERPAEPLGIHADRDRIQQILINLLNNAFKFTPQGQVKLTASGEKGFVLFHVSDTGKGIADADKPQVFDLFYQVHDENRRSTKEFGTGLGLAICRQIVTHYGGTISVTSVENEGSTFTFSIPAV